MIPIRVSLLVQLRDKKSEDGQSMAINKKLTQLNAAVLGLISGKLDGSSWDSVKSSIEDIWALEKIAESKVSIVLVIHNDMLQCMIANR